MKRQDIQRATKEVVLDVFENMYFMFPEVIAEDDPEPSFPESCFKATVAVKNGSEMFVLYGSEKLVVDMAKNLLGTDRPVAEAELMDVFKESANIISGNLVTALDTEWSIELDVPVAERWHASSQLDEARGCEGCVFQIEDELLKVLVC
ncbi:MAG: chemotaxis protein CheX [Desulfobacterales bacterium]|nr:chemotaxis protein CheX [Desulfobacterales bacterium]